LGIVEGLVEIDGRTASNCAQYRKKNGELKVEKVNERTLEEKKTSGAYLCKHFFAASL